MTVVAASHALAGIRDGAVVVDVRSALQFQRDAWPGSLSLPLDMITTGAVPDVPTDSVVYLVCEVGGFSQLAALHLRAAGFGAAFSVRGGLVALRALAQAEPRS